MTCLHCRKQENIYKKCSTLEMRMNSVPNALRHLCKDTEIVFDGKGNGVHEYIIHCERCKGYFRLSEYPSRIFDFMDITDTLMDTNAIILLSCFGENVSITKYVESIIHYFYAKERGILQKGYKGEHRKYAAIPNDDLYKLFYSKSTNMVVHLYDDEQQVACEYLHTDTLGEQLDANTHTLIAIKAAYEECEYQLRPYVYREQQENKDTECLSVLLEINRERILLLNPITKEYEYFEDPTQPFVLSSGAKGVHTSWIPNYLSQDFYKKYLMELDGRDSLTQILRSRAYKQKKAIRLNEIRTLFYAKRL